MRFLTKYIYMYIDCIELSFANKRRYSFNTPANTYESSENVRRTFREHFSMFQESFENVFSNIVRYLGRFYLKIYIINKREKYILRVIYIFSRREKTLTLLTRSLFLIKYMVNAPLGHIPSIIYYYRIR